jgi:hypothetical protein
MFSARPAAMKAGYPRHEPAAGKNAAIGSFTQYFTFKVHIVCAASLAAGR